MCITNQMTDKILKDIRMIEKEGTKNIDSNDLASFLAYAKILEESIKDTKEKVKAELCGRKEGEIFYFPDIEKKVYLAEGNTVTFYNTKSIYEEMDKIGVGDSFFEIINVVKNKVEDLQDEEIAKIVDANSHSGKGESIIKVFKMSKKELLENAKVR